MKTEEEEDKEEEKEEDEEEAMESEKALPGTFSGTAALQGLMFLRTLCTWPDEMVGVGKGNWGVPMCVCTSSLLCGWRSRSECKRC